MNGFRNTRGPLVLTLMAFSPPIVLPTGGGDTISVSIGAVTGEYEIISRNCDGDVLSSEGVPFRSGGLVVDFVESDRPVRYTAFGGVTSVRANVPSPGFPGMHEGGAFGGAILAYEGDRIGVGAGPVILTGPEDRAAPSIYLRLGDREGAHFRGDVLGPTSLPGATGRFRAGVGFGGESVSGLVGVSGGRPFDLSVEDNAGPFAEIAVGVTPTLEALFGGSWHSAEVHSDWGAGFGIRWTRGR